jgi:putative PIG3 family NAD(P)H quinone oxidoreductase
MKAMVVQAEKEGRPLEWTEVEAPAYGPDEVLVDVYATALNRADLMQRAGKYPPPPGESDIIGLEMAGTIAALGEKVTGWSVGDRVCALLPGGGYAEQAKVPSDMLMPIPAAWSFEQAAAMPEAFFTAYVNLFMEAGLRPGETVLIHGGASGVGTAGIQLAHQAGCRVFVTAGTAAKTARCESLGAELAINYNTDDFAERIMAYTGGNGVDVILDMVGASYFERNIDLLNVKGRLVFISTLSGMRVDLDLRKLMSKRLRLIGSVLRARSLAEKIEIKERFMEQFWPALIDGSVQPIIDQVYPIQEVNQAHQAMTSNQNIGKLVLQLRR